MLVWMRSVIAVSAEPLSGGVGAIVPASPQIQRQCPHQPMQPADSIARAISHCWRNTMAGNLQSADQAIWLLSGQVDGHLPSLGGVGSPVNAASNAADAFRELGEQLVKAFYRRPTDGGGQATQAFGVGQFADPLLPAGVLAERPAQDGPRHGRVSQSVGGVLFKPGGD